MSLKQAFIAALSKEMEIRKEYLEGEILETIYFGGGTPSQLFPDDFKSIFETIYRLFQVKPDAEVTLEANPDDMNGRYIKDLCSLPFNRISMGIQSFRSDNLCFLERRHTGRQAVRAVSECKENGLDNISIDLIYGLPGQTPEQWKENLVETLKLEIPHISAYHLTYEEDTRLYQLLEKKEIHPAGEEISLLMFTILIDVLKQAGYVHYELSNFSKPGKLSLHNSSYWTGKKYLGLGPSAHSYDINSRQWNVSSIRKYIEGMNNNQPAIEKEMLNIHKRYNDYIITGLRTMWGIDTDQLLTNFGKEKEKYCLMQANPFINRGLIHKSGNKLLLSREGMFISDTVMSDLLWV
jgi:oxygen-independent coproporphyrinogen-3 oxidase